MSVSEENKRIIVIVAAGITMMPKKSNKRKRSVWVKDYRSRYNDIPLIQHLRENYPEDYKNYLRMDNTCFDYLLNLVKVRILKKDTIMRKAIGAEEKLVATLRFLATGRSYEDFKFSTGISAPTLSILIPQPCKAIYEALKEAHMKFTSMEEEWMLIAKGFYEKLHFVNWWCTRWETHSYSTACP
ncbi:uncharacterized protein LOC126744235 [Anthonomus grandis grandis]|uniref:uncharacterized protein LOC126744235 n=1 Tax=Anthonomus grandis grandis TaxID=2921223 RepID=UPI00216566E0|nr:uncharacterized protein LOC126744235 [Anthonomus grandis grandis]